MKFSTLVVSVVALLVPAVAHAGPATFNGVCAASATTTQAKCTSVAGASGAVTIKSTTDSTLSVMITAWQANQATTGVNAGKITAANLGAYDGGFGVTGLGDNNGNDGLHQIDNAGGYTDFIMLQFSRAVQLTSATLNAYGIGNSTDTDISIFNLGAVMAAPSSWNSSVNLATIGANDSTIWTQFTGQDSRTAMLNTSAFSQVWLISAAQLPANDRDDGFKLSKLVVNATPSVPEPATWAMLIMGFGAIGATLRRRAATGTLATA